MDDQGVRQVIKYIETNCINSLTPKQAGRLYEMKHMANYNIYKLRILYRIAIDNFLYPECPYCKKPITQQDDLTIDHIVPKSKGGTDDIENLQPMHKLCNSDKGCLMPEITKCEEVPLKKRSKHRSAPKRKEREIVKSRTSEELYKKCKKIDQARTNKCRANFRSYVK